MSKQRAIILSSGGLDSTTVIAIAQKQAMNVFPKL